MIGRSRIGTPSTGRGPKFLGRTALSQAERGGARRGGRVMVAE